MGVPQAVAKRQGNPEQKPRPKRWRRQQWRYVLLGLAAWLAVSHFVVRARIEGFLAETFDGRARVGWALLLPTLDAVAFDSRVEGDSFSLRAPRIQVHVRVWGLLGAAPVESVTVHGLDAVLMSGQRLHLLRERVREGDPVADDPDLDPLRLPALTFDLPRITLSESGEVFSAGRVEVAQVGERSFRCETDAGALAGIPFERLTAHLIPRAGRVLLNDLKLRAFNGMIGGFLDFDLAHAGAMNGELEWHFVETEALWHTYGLPYAEKRRGDLSGKMVVSGDRPEWEALRGTGEIALTRARFFSPLSFRVLGVLKVPVEEESMLTDATMRFSFERSLFFVERARLHAQGYTLEAQGILSFAGKIDLEVAHAGTTVALSGTLAEPRIKVLPFDHVTAPFHRLFRERVR